MIFAVDEINKDPNLLPNDTLGYHIFDTCGDPKRSLGYVLQILSGEKMEVPNYSCRDYGEVAGFIGDTTFHTSHAMAQLLSLYQYPQVNYRVTDPLMSDQRLYPTFYQTIQDDRVRYTAIIKCLKHFGWNWVGMIMPSDGSGEMELQELSKMMARHEICIEYIIKLTNDENINRQRMAVTERSNSKLHKIFGKVQYRELIKEEILFHTRAEMPSELTLANWIISENKSKNQFIIKPLITFDKILQEDEVLKLKPQDITWKKGKIPESRCTDRCPPGYRKSPNGQIYVCCYDCIPCSEGEVSNVTDSENCYKCLKEKWADERKIKCIPRIYEFFSNENNIMAQIFSFFAVLLSVMTLFILGNVIYYRDTPIVKANNRTVSFILLTSILLSFLCVFLFLGRPVDITCMLRQISFGIFFSIAVSSVLAKTITVCIAFKASKPGSNWSKWVGMRVSNSVVLLCPSVQVLICVIWLSVSPPYQEYDMDSYPGKIIIQCNEGSVVGFYSMLGYMGFLAAVSFVLAFMVRTLPDSFNEAKYITFSMLVFCSVWIAMIPAYLSTRGKYMVAVEVFAILTSSAGVLCCIFFPKVYILFLNTNSQKIILRTVFKKHTNTI
ncbi:vomeronasal type-2 receptor 26-like [Pyxicephalus adspersus]|uniref:vomeronasal type-2 receptor 26-like n=1 Tax=Pyxicephalus adspersus TaxID=30357 RepID=UPI003B5A48EA